MTWLFCLQVWQWSEIKETIFNTRHCRISCHWCRMTPDSPPYSAWNVHLKSTPALWLLHWVPSPQAAAARRSAGFWEQIIRPNTQADGLRLTSSAPRSLWPQSEWTQGAGPRNLLLLLRGITAKSWGKRNTLCIILTDSSNWVSYQQKQSSLWLLL